MAQDPNWISVGDLAEGFAPESNILPFCHDLAGVDLKLVFEDGHEQNLIIERLGNEQFIKQPGKDPVAVRVTSLRQDLYFVDYLADQKSVTMLIDRASGQVLRIVGAMPSSAETAKSLLTRAKEGLPLSAVKADFQAGHIASKPRQPGFERTTELVGKRIRYRYSPTELYEHIYLNDSFYTWQCISGVEAGLADTDLCHFFKLRDELYLFVWQEKIVPTLGVVTVDLQKNKTDGKIFGYSDFESGQLSNFSIGAYAMFANYTPNPDMA